LKSVRSYYDSQDKILKKDIGLGIPGQGVFQVDQDRATLSFISNMPSKEESSFVATTNGADHPNFLKEDFVKGWRTYVLRFPDQEGGYTDLYFAPDLNDRIIQQIAVSTRGIAVTEPLQINLGEPDDAAFGSLPKFSVNYERFKEKIRAMDEARDQQAADAMRQQLDHQIAIQIRDHL
jgi:hypothetical protein